MSTVHVAIALFGGGALGAAFTRQYLGATIRNLREELRLSGGEVYRLKGQVATLGGERSNLEIGLTEPAPKEPMTTPPGDFYRDVSRVAARFLNHGYDVMLTNDGQLGVYRPGNNGNDENVVFRSGSGFDPSAFLADLDIPKAPRQGPRSEGDSEHG